MQIDKKYIKNFDVPLLLITMALVVIGILMVGNATGNPEASMSDGWRQVIASMNKTKTLLTVLWVLVGIIAAGVVIFFDYHTYGDAEKIIYWATVGLLLLVLIIGKVTNGTKGWLANGSIQPSELAKLALVIVLAKRLSKMPEGIRTVKELLKILAVVAVPLALIVLQPDYGTMLVYVFITLVMLFISGTSWKLLLGMFGTAAAVAFPVWNLVGNTQRNRILALIDPNSVKKSALYNVTQSITAIGSGQMNGRGFFAPGSFGQLDYIPIKETDFIFSITAETLGFIGAGIIIFLYGLLLVRMLMLSRKSFDRFGSYLIIGVMALFAFHIFENIGMTMGVMPCTGIPLPFLSYGGSNMVTNLIAIGLVENVCIRRRYSIFKDGEAF